MKKLETTDMSSLTKILPFILLLTTTTFFATAIPVKVDTYCTPTTTYEPSSFYHKNLNSVFTSLTSQSNSLSFSNSSFGTSPNDVYGLFYCRYDLPSSACSSCVKAAVAEITSNCTKEKEAITWYDDCTLRYANRNIFSLEDESLFHWRISTMNVSISIDTFNQVFFDTLVLTINQAAYNSSSSKRYFKKPVANISSVDTLYVLVQCTPDIDSDSCAHCLRVTVRDPPFGGTALGMFFRPSCMIMCEIAPFFEVPLPPPSSSPSTSKGGVIYYMIKAVIPGAVGLLMILLGITIFFKTRRAAVEFLLYDHGEVETHHGEDRSVQFDFKMLVAATNNFSEANKLGQGGFGIVYRGVLQNGQQVAVKRLSKVSGQGAKEIKTNIEVIAQLQHRNLVRLVGYCIAEIEWFMIYEYMPNLSLDNFLFGSAMGASLTWEVRCNIIAGIACGLQYLHQVSRIKIVHQDLKTSNIMLDENMNPKIADFGMARLMRVDSDKVVVRSVEYRAPEYLSTGRCTSKSDIYSFGVIILEILSGKRCSQFYQGSHAEGLLRFAWRVWSEDAIEQLVDPILENNYSRNEVERCIRIALLCVQDDEACRPTTYALLRMLDRSTSVQLPSPLNPTVLFNSTGMPSGGGDPQGGQTSYQETDPADIHLETNLSAH